MAYKPADRITDEGRAQIAMLCDLLLSLGARWPDIRVELFRLMQGRDAKFDEVPSESSLERMLLHHFECTSMTDYREKRKDSLKTQLKRKAVTMALGGHATMLIFCLKNLCGWTDQPVNLSDDTLKDGLRIAYNRKDPSDNLSTEG